MSQGSFEDFAARHGEYIEIDRGVKFFQDGAVASEATIDRPAHFQEPPSDPREAMRLRRHFHQAQQTSRQESDVEFADRHGNKPIQIGSRLVFPDGAECDPRAGVRSEPPTDQIENLRSRRRYVVAKLESEIANFTAFKNDCQQKADWAAQNISCCAPPADAVDQLLRGKGRIEALRNDLRAIDEQLGPTPEAAARLARAQDDAERRQRLASLSQKISAVTLNG